MSRLSLFAALVTLVTPVPGAAQTGESASAETGITIVEHEGSWADLTGLGPGGELADAGSFYLIRGALRNDSPRPIGYVRLSYELVNDSGEKVFGEYGYNRKAEKLRDEAFESGDKPLHEMDVDPIPAGEADTFRMFFFADETPSFSDYRVEVETAPGAPSAAAPGSRAERPERR